MKHIKLFENFNQDDLEEIKWIMIDLDEYSHLDQNELGGNLLIYDIDSDIDMNKLEITKKRLDYLGYTLIKREKKWNSADNFIIIYNNDYFQDIINKNDPNMDNPIIWVAFKWISDKFKGLIKSQDMNKTYYKNEKGDKIFMFFNNPKNPDCFINNDLLYSFLENKMYFPHLQIQAIIIKWLNESYHLDNFSEILEHDF